MSYKEIIYSVEDKVLTITLNRPDKLNAFTRTMLDELLDALDRADADDEVRAIIVTGAGRGFCAGADLDASGDTFAQEGKWRLDPELEERTAPWNLTTPIIGAINGPAVGIGATLPLGFDVRYASETARIGFVFTRRGITPEAGLIDNPVPKTKNGPRIPAQTEFVRLATFERYSWLEARPKTGRLHQIRRHLKHISHPIIGDVRFGKGEHNRLFRARFGLHRMALHAAQVSFPHPDRDEVVSLTAPLPEDLAGPLAQMGLPTDPC